MGKTDPVDYERIPVPRCAYLELIRSCERLKWLIRAKKTRKHEVIVFCYECGVYLPGATNPKRALCDECKEAGKMKQEAREREEWMKRSKETSKRRKQKKG